MGEMVKTTVLDPPGPLQVERLPDGRRKLLRELSCKVEDRTITVPEGFKTDFSSDPIGLLDWSKVDVAGVVHDYLYQCPKIVGSRWKEDVIWFRIARSGPWKTSLASAFLGFVGIVLFGWLFRKITHPLRHRAAVIAFALTIVAAIINVIRCLWFKTGDPVELALCLLAALLGLRTLVSARRSQRRRKLTGRKELADCPPNDED